MLLLLLVLGAIATFQALLFTCLSAAEQIAFDGSYHYPIAEIPFLIDWEKLNDPELYDIRLLWQINETIGLRQLIFFGSIFLLGGIFKSWIDFFISTKEQS